MRNHEMLKINMFEVKVISGPLVSILKPVAGCDIKGCPIAPGRSKFSKWLKGRQKSECACPTWQVKIVSGR